MFTSGEAERRRLLGLGAHRVSFVYIHLPDRLSGRVHSCVSWRQERPSSICSHHRHPYLFGIVGARDTRQKAGMSDLDKAIAQLRSCRPIPESQVRELCYKARELLIEEGNVVTVNAPVTVGHSPLFHSRPLLTTFRYAATSTANSMT
jgi:hypothetical protein